ncbi:tyrosine--tRNA ligase [Patescibacteria group bacterium]|nr:tyrosine--tRNA ligase [Patescibacteria group bacterium]
MQFSIHPDVFKLFPDFKVGLLVVTGLDQSKADMTTIGQLLSDSIKHAQAEDWPTDRRKVWEDAFRKINLNVDEIKPSHLALVERVKKNGDIPSILPIVDIANSYSLKHGVPVGTHSLDALSEDIIIRPTTSVDRFVAMNKTEAEGVQEGVLAYTSGQQVLTKNFAWRQGELSKVRPDTRNVIIPIDTFGTVSEGELLTIIKELKTLLQAQVGGTIQTAILSKTTPSFEWSQDASLTEKNSQVWEVLTRGVAEVLPSAETLAPLMSQRKIRVYLGIDPTGHLLTLGHAVVLRKLQQFADLGHDVILLIGNGTVRIGDPTGRDSTRPVLTDEQIRENFKNWQTQASKILDFNKIRVVYNGDWLDKLTYADIVKLLAQTTIQQLIERDMFQDRLKKNLPIHGHEIIYPLLQGYDSVAMDVDLEIGGTDQTFNMMMGRHLQRVYNNHEKWVLTTPIINGTDGRKMSKSYGNFIALTEEPNNMYGKIMSIADEMIIEYFALLTDVPLPEVEEIRAALAKGENPMPFKKKLAHAITAAYHSEAAADAAEKHFQQTVQEKQVPTDIPVVQLTGNERTILDVLKACPTELSTSELKRLIEQGGVELLPSGLKPGSVDQVFDRETEIIRVGKRRYFRLERGK